MRKKHRQEQTSKSAASAAGRVLNDPDSSPDERTAAASALTQAPDRSEAPHVCALKGCEFVSVEIPEKCPGCGNRFAEKNT
jgi:hypothetical protein